METMHSENTPEADASGNPTGFVPKFPYDLEKGSAKGFQPIVEKYDEWHMAEPIAGPLAFGDGWQTITPEIAEELLRRNKPGANRKLSFASIQYYARAMEADEWPQTGQPIIFDANGALGDGQHRLWACLLSGTSFTTYVVTNVPHHPQLFAYFDNGKVRTPADALQTAGFNGVSPTIAKVLKIASEIDGYTPSSTERRARLTPIEFVRLAEMHPNARAAARYAASDWAQAVSVVGHQDVVAYVGMRIMDIHDQISADDFFGELGDLPGDYPPEGSIMKFRKLIADDQKKEKPMKRHQVLGNMIKAFNAWRARSDLPKRWVMAVNDDYPVIEGSDTDRQMAAE